ncbi:MAG: bifunctional metallophosphatase/5'-nucleotidase [Xanthobacteraceae bacterium]
MLTNRPGQDTKSMPLVTRRIATGLLLVPLAAPRLASAAATATRITFVHVNDIYLMGDELMPDDRRRGGFARLSAVLKAERAHAEREGRHVIFAHAGDTLSPSLMSSIDQGAHIITLTNLLRPDIFAPGNHEYDFGKDIFLTRMREAQFPRYAANLRSADGRPLEGFQDRSMISVGALQIGLTGATFDDSVRASDPGDLRFVSAVATLEEQARALRKDGADFVIAVAHVTREQAYDLFRSRTVDLILTGHTHDLLINYDERTALVESSYDAHYVTAIDIDIDITQEQGIRHTSWWPRFRVIDTATVTPDAEVANVVTQFESQLSKELDAPIGTTAVELDSRTATVRGGEAAIGGLIADALRWSAQTDAAVTNGGSIRGGKVYPAGSTLTRRDILSELPFGNRLVTLEISGRELKAALENGLSQLPTASGRFPQVSGLEIEADTRRPAGSRILSVKVGNAALDEGKIYLVASNDFMQHGGDDYTAFQKARTILPPGDSPLMAYEVIDYIKDVGTVRTNIAGRLVLR